MPKKGVPEHMPDPSPPSADDRAIPDDAFLGDETFAAHMEELAKEREEERAYHTSLRDALNAQIDALTAAVERLTTERNAARDEIDALTAEINDLMANEPSTIDTLKTIGMYAIVRAAILLIDDIDHGSGDWTVTEDALRKEVHTLPLATIHALVHDGE